MSKFNTYTQCYMKKKLTSRVGWIPTEFAKKNDVVDLKLNGKWSKGWTVVYTMSSASHEYIEAREMDYTKQREASDI